MLQFIANKLQDVFVLEQDLIGGVLIQKIITHWHQVEYILKKHNPLNIYTKKTTTNTLFLLLFDAPTAVVTIASIIAGIAFLILVFASSLCGLLVYKTDENSPLRS